MFTYTILVNSNHPLASDYQPKDLTETNIPFAAEKGNPKRLLRKKAALAAYELFRRGASMGYILYGISGYRSYTRQKELYNHSPYIAAPGTSEHQTGLALDVSCKSVQYQLEEGFANTPEAEFIREYGPLYGFILRYPKNKEHITGIPFEPWHLRYVSQPLSLYLSLTDLCLEEYYDMKKARFIT